MTVQMDPDFASALRGALIEKVEASTKVRRTKLLSAAVALVVLIGGGVGIGVTIGRPSSTISPGSIARQGNQILVVPDSFSFRYPQGWFAQIAMGSPSSGATRLALVSSRPLFEKCLNTSLDPTPCTVFRPVVVAGVSVTWSDFGEPGGAVPDPTTRVDGRPANITDSAAASNGCQTVIGQIRRNSANAIVMNACIPTADVGRDTAKVVAMFRSVRLAS